MLLEPRLFRRHRKGREYGEGYCSIRHEDTLDRCTCNIGYKGLDPATRKFRRLMFDPPIADQMAAMRRLIGMEKRVPPEEKEPPIMRERLLISEAFDRYIQLVQGE